MEARAILNSFEYHRGKLDWWLTRFAARRRGRFDIFEIYSQALSGIVAKTVRTAVANAENTQSIDVDRLFVKLAKVDEAGMWKRFTSRAQGRATRVRKRLSHITIVLDETQERS